MNNKRIRILASGLAALGIFASLTHGASAALTGSCGMVVSLPHNYVLGSMSGTMNTSNGAYSGNFQLASPGSTKGVNVLAVLDFNTSTISFNVTQVTIGNPNTYGTSEASTPFTTAAGPLPNSYTITFTPPSSTAINLNLLPVNSGNTILVQGTASGASALVGVCQAL
ncbi:MAG: hypothetical protein ACYDHM_15065 [Acidiferrobacterales bacterium]